MAGLLVRELAPTPGRGGATSAFLACMAAAVPIRTARIPLALIVIVAMPLIT